MALFLLGRRGFHRVMTAIRPSSVASGKKPVNGVDLYYEQTGRGKHAVLLLPGALGNFCIFYNSKLCYCFDTTYFLKKKSFIWQTLGFGKFSLLGWSDGGITALVAAARNPDMINKMVVWGANAFVSQQDLKLYNGVRDVSKWSARMRQPMEEVYGVQVFAKLWEAWVDGMAQFVHRPEGSICMEHLPLISCPTLIIHGEKDPMVPNLHPEYLLKHIKGSRLHLMPEGKHNLHLRYADEFNTLVEDFLEE
uniref:Biphenyl hydrolase like n=1 Tax=Neolamprologus brichardi TaxID=32507 RepID=A0A3Q4I4Y4_NEOBR